jgi:hypothetical protein
METDMEKLNRRGMAPPRSVGIQSPALHLAGRVTDGPHAHTAPPIFLYLPESHLSNACVI